MENQTKTRLAGAWTRMNGTTPMGRLHAVRRVNGALEPNALCGFKVSEKAQRTRPFPIFNETEPHACSTCVTETWDMP